MGPLRARAAAEFELVGGDSWRPSAYAGVATSKSMAASTSGVNRYLQQRRWHASVNPVTEGRAKINAQAAQSLIRNVIASECQDAMLLLEEMTVVRVAIKVAENAGQLVREPSFATHPSTSTKQTSRLRTLGRANTFAACSTRGYTHARSVAAIPTATRPTTSAKGNSTEKRVSQLSNVHR